MLKYSDLLNGERSDLATTIILRERYGRTLREVAAGLASETPQLTERYGGATPWLSDRRWQIRGAALLTRFATLLAEQTSLDACFKVAFDDSDGRVRGIALWLLGTAVQNAHGYEALQRIATESLGQHVEFAGSSVDAIAKLWLNRIACAVRFTEVQLRRRAIERDYIERNAGEDASLIMAEPMRETFLRHPLCGKRLAALMAIRLASVAGDSLPTAVPEMMERDPDAEVRRCAVETYRASYSRTSAPHALKRLAAIVLDDLQENIVRLSAYEAALDVAGVSRARGPDSHQSSGAGKVPYRPGNALAGCGWPNGVDWNFVRQCWKGDWTGRQEGQGDLLAAIEAVLELKFARPGLALMAKIQEIDDVELLRKILDAVKRAPSPDALRQLVP